ncbi:MAG: NAD-dependent epimerase/dehydratase family protein [Oligoflexales bacterium]|nr:NAD-dependent epimerase/dehydratase family protein [Oligoflexales bacterium]
MPMKVFVTGGCGFLGSHVCEYFIKKGDEVISYDNMTKYEIKRTGLATEEVRDYNWNYLKKLGIKLIKADIRNFEELVDSSSGCNYIIHTAAQPAMTISWEEPRLDLETNVIGTFNVLDTARRHNIPVACCATVHVYGNSINEKLKETENRYVFQDKSEFIDENYPTLGGKLSPLHGSKITGDIYTRVFSDTYNLKAASFRLTGIYGTRQFGGEDHGWVANFAIRSVLDWPLTIFGTGKQVRDIIYATDVCEAFDAFYKKQVSGIYNIGGGRRTMISLLECIALIEEINGRKCQVKFAPDRFADLRYFVCDISKAKKELDWEPRIVPREGIEILLDWIKENRVFLKS